MVTSRFNSLKIKNSLILISVMVPLLIIFLSYSIYRQGDALRTALLERGVILAQTGAETTGKILSDAIKYGKLTESQVFDKDYKLIPNTSPQKYHTQYDTYTDENLRQIEDAFLKDKVVVYAVAVDTNGYLPTHNTKFSQVGKGRNLDRSKRLFDDPVGNAAAQNTKPYLRQEYPRDTGEIMWDISSPIYVNGKHWGGFRIGFSIDETNKQIAAATQRSIVYGSMLTVALILLSVYISNRISNPVKLLEEEANRIASGDFSLSSMVTDARDEVGSLMRSFVNMIIKLRDLAEKTLFSTRLIATYTRDLMQNTEDAAETAETVKTKMALVADTMKKMEEDTERIAETTKRASENLSEAETSSEKFLDSMEKSKDAMFVAHDVIKELESQVEKVGSVIQVVSILADQAGQLARKAVKEAKNYCTEESDFSDLATEIQTRAADAASTTQEISYLFQTVRDHARHASDALEDHRQVILKGITVARLSYKSLTTTISDLQNLAGLTKDVLDNSRQLVDGVHSINEEVESQTALVQRFTEAAGTLEQVVGELQETLNMLKV
ncbi:MAG: methyl-accepting chemotaxis protein [Bacillota bacterium]